MIIVVTGASGHIGNNLVRELVAHGHAVRAIYLGDEEPLLDVPCERIQADVRDAAAMARVMAGADTLYHLAALISISGSRNGLVSDVNVRGVQTVMRSALAAGVRRVVHCSSVHAFDLSPRATPVDETSPRPRPEQQAAYDLSKAAGEVEVRKVIADGLDAVIINPSGVLGPRDTKPSRLGRVLRDIARRRLPMLLDGGFDWVDVRDVVKGAIAAAERGRTGENYILSGAWTTTRELAEITHSLIDIRPPRFNAPIWLARAAVPLAALAGRITATEPVYTHESLDTLLSNRNISHAKAKRELDHNPRPLRDSLADLFEWYCQTGVLPSSIRVRR